jgi:hypothetical protein
LELTVAAALREANVQTRIRDALVAPERLLEELVSVAGSRVRNPAEGPIALGDIRQLGQPAAMASLAGCYLAAFGAGIRSFPYFEEMT